jgi:hypothetical protein
MAHIYNHGYLGAEIGGLQFKVSLDKKLARSYLKEQPRHSGAYLLSLILQEVHLERLRF